MAPRLVNSSTPLGVRGDFGDLGVRGGLLLRLGKGAPASGARRKDRRGLHLRRRETAMHARDEIRMTARPMMIKTVTKLFAPELAWCKAAMGQTDETLSVRTDIHALPLDSGPGVSAAVELKLFEAPVGVVSVSVALATSDLALPGHAGGGS